MTPFQTKEEATEWLSENLPFTIRGIRSEKFISPFSSGYAQNQIVESLSDKLWDRFKVENYNDCKTNINALLSAICDIKGVTVEQVRSKSRKRELVDVRHSFGVIAKETFPKEKYPRMSLKKIGSYIGKGHCDILRYINEVRDVREKRAVYQDIKEQLKLK